MDLKYHLLISYFYLNFGSKEAELNRAKALISSDRYNQLNWESKGSPIYQPGQVKR